MPMRGKRLSIGVSAAPEGRGVVRFEIPVLIRTGSLQRVHCYESALGSGKATGLKTMGIDLNRQHDFRRDVEP
jgi:hypothetical protein